MPLLFFEASGFSHANERYTIGAEQEASCAHAFSARF